MGIFNRLEDILLWFTPQQYLDDLHVRKRVHMFLISHIFGPIVASPIPIFLYFNDPSPRPHVDILAASIFGFWAFLAAVKLFGQHYRIIAQASIVNFSFAILWGVYNYGGASSPFMAWFIVLPLVAFFYFGSDTQTRIFIFSQITLGIGALYAAYVAGGSFPVNIANEDLVTIGLVSAFCCATYVFFMASYYSSVVDSQSALLKEIDGHKNTLAQLQDAKDIAERANKAKSDFLAKMSHELRTPLNAVLGYTEILLEDAEIAGDGNQIADLNKISGAGKHLLSMVNDILDISKIEAGRMELNVEEIELARLVAEIEHTARPLAAKNANELLVEIESDLGVLKTDPTKLRQVIFNLLSNASKFTQNGSITLKAESLELEGRAMLAISVTDTGIGISDAQKEALFANFSQADSRISAVYGGTGLGLSLSRNLAKLMGGDIVVESQVDVGSTFTLRIARDAGSMALLQHPTSDEAEDDAVLEAEANLKARSDGHSGLNGHSPDHQGRAHVVIVDDDPEFLDLAERLCLKAGYSPICTKDPSAAMQLARTVKPAAILVDILMPVMDGWEVLRNLKADSTTSDLPVVMLSAVDERAKAREKGSDGFLAKPLKPSKLTEVMDTIIKRGKTAAKSAKVKSTAA